MCVSPIVRGCLQLYIHKVNQTSPECIAFNLSDPSPMGDTVQLIQSSFTFQQEKSSTTCKLLLHVVNMLSFSVQQKLSKSLTCTRK